METVGSPLTFKEYQRAPASTVADSDAKNKAFPRLVKEISLVMEITRKDELDSLPDQLTKTFNAWVALASTLEIDLDEALWHKYPGVCGRCLKEENCVCGPEHPQVHDRENELARRRAERWKMPKTIQEHQFFHNKIYGWQNDMKFVIQAAAHLCEELGEVAEEIYLVEKPDNEKLADEMADIGSWLFALANRKKINLSAIITK